MPENHDLNGAAVQAAMKNNTKTYDKTHYKETFSDPNQKDTRIDA